MSDRPVFIFGSHKSGTSLLRSLLDGHSELQVLPRETHFFKSAGYWIDYGLMKSFPEPLSGEEILQRMIATLESQNRSIDPFSDNPDFTGFDLDRFMDSIPATLPDQHGKLFEVFMGACYNAYTGNEPTEHARFVEKSVEHAEYAGVLRRFFPAAKFVHIVRNPYAAVVAIRRSRSGKRYPKMRRVITSLYNSYYNLFKNLDEQASYLVTRYEDLLQDPEGEMKKISGYLEIDWDAGLLQPTDGGDPWKGNSTSGERFSGISTSPLNSWKEHISHFDIHLVNRIAGPVFHKFDYSSIKPSKSSYLPAKGEALSRYIGNRYLLSTLRSDDR